MDDVLHRIELLNIPVGRRIFALTKVIAAARTRDPDVLARAEAALAEDRKAAARRDAWVANRTRNRHADGAAAIDHQLDTLVNSLDAILGSQHKALADTEHGVTAGQLLLHLFPRGTRAITHAAYEVEHSELTAMIERCRTREAGKTVWDPRLARYGVLDLLQTIDRLLPEFEPLIAPPRGGPSYDTVRADQLAGQDRLVALIWVIGGRYVDGTPADLATRASLWDPIFAQEEAVRARLRARRAVTDVDPHSGEEVADPTSAALGQA